MSLDSPIGVITKGSLVEGLEMKLDPGYSIEDVKAGKFVVVRGEKHEFFSLITDVRLDATNPEILLHPPAEEDLLLRRVLAGHSTFATVSLRPMLMLERGEALAGEGRPQPVKTIPAHFAPVFEAREEDVNRIFGDEHSSPRHFSIGQPLDMTTPVCLNLDRFVERSNGIFGKTGTGKTFLTRLVLAGLISRKHGEVVNLIFDMHSEYGWSAMQEGGAQVKGLKQIFGSQVAIFSLDPESTRRRGATADVDVYLAYEDIFVEDIAPLQEELRLNPTAVESAYAIVARYGKDWLKELLNRADIKEFADELGVHSESLAALQRKLRRLQRFPFLTPERQGRDVIQTLMDYLQRGTHIVLEFGQQNSVLCYLLVANILTRRIHDLYVRQSEQYLATQRPQDRPKQLVITIEEAHKFLNPQAARQTPFGLIAREMRKYHVSLLIVDQRPSGIDDEVLSQVGTRIVALLNDEKDIQAVLTGVSGTSGLRSVLASLDTKQQALILGHAVPMPVVIKTRDYDTAFYRAMGTPPGRQEAQLEADVEALFGR
jgi:DNA helicase HerA-like ATPase